MANRKAQNEKQQADQPDQYDRDLVRDNRRQAENMPEVEPRGGAEPEMSEAQRQYEAGAGPRNFQKDRTGQAQSPVELTPNEPPKDKEGHR